MYLPMDSIHKPVSKKPAVPSPRPPAESRRPHPAAAFLPVLQVHPAAGTLSLPPNGRFLGPTNSGSTDTSWSSSSDMTGSGPGTGGPEEEGGLTSQSSPLTEEGNVKGASFHSSGQGSSLGRPLEPKAGQGSTPSPNETPPTQSAAAQPDLIPRHVQVSVEPEEGPQCLSSPSPFPNQPLASHSAPIVLDGEQPRPLALPPGVYPTRAGPAPDLWKTPFWIIEDFQAPRQLSHRGDEAQPASPPPPASPGPTPAQAFPVSQCPPYYDLEAEDLASFRALYPPPEPCVPDSELMSVPDDDLEFWGLFYFAGVESARGLLRQRRRPPKFK